MKKIFAVFLFFAGFNLFAQKQEIGRLTWEFRDYDRDWRKNSTNHIIPPR